MKKLTIIFCIMLIVNCQRSGLKGKYKEKEDKTQIQDSIPKCNGDLSPVIEIWNHTGTNFIIGDWGKRNDNYLKSEGWNLSDFPYPKKFDLKLIIVNNPILFDNLTYKIGNWHLSLIVKFKVGQNQDAVYPLNSKIYDTIEVIKDTLITDADFRKKGELTDHIEILQNDVEFEFFYLKYRNKGLFLNQLVFEVLLISENKSTCIYEYVFPMAERGE
ncbi:MAG: hypothetical protein GW774_13970 [Flavobacteriales bacterium]|nr:hypothetical protein [Flavobacteriales bacterium]